MQFKKVLTQRKMATEGTLQIQTSSQLPKTDRQVTALHEHKEILYDNRIFNIKKKYTLPIEKFDLNTKHTNIELKQLPKYKHSSYFSKYLDSVQKNHPLLRRGACDAAIPSNFSNMQTHRETRIKTEGCSQMTLSQKQKAGSFRSANNTDTSKKEKRGQQEEQKLLHKNLPILTLRGNKIEELILPIRVQEFVSKGARKVKNLSPEDLSKRNKNLMLRKLDVELINYSLLGKWNNNIRRP